LGEQWRQYEKIFPALNKSRIRQVSLEAAGSKVPLSLIRLLPDKQILVGVIDVADPRVETAEEVAATIESALQYADRDRLQGCTNCGLAPLPKSVAASKLEALCKGVALARARHAV
jgi:5-methyltetrahydropteroyltriglutamate--homocysteine methyltransferase